MKRPGFAVTCGGENVLDWPGSSLPNVRAGEALRSACGEEEVRSSEASFRSCVRSSTAVSGAAPAAAKEDSSRWRECKLLGRLVDEGLAWFSRLRRYACELPPAEALTSPGFVAPGDARVGEWIEEEDGLRMNDATKSEAEMGRSREAPVDISVPDGVLCDGATACCEGAGGELNLRRFSRLALRAFVPASGNGVCDVESTFGLWCRTC